MITVSGYTFCEYLGRPSYTKGRELCDCGRQVTLELHRVAHQMEVGAYKGIPLVASELIPQVFEDHAVGVVHADIFPFLQADPKFRVLIEEGVSEPYPFSQGDAPARIFSYGQIWTRDKNRWILHYGGQWGQIALEGGIILNSEELSSPRYWTRHVQVASREQFEGLWVEGSVPDWYLTDSKWQCRRYEVTEEARETLFREGCLFVVDALPSSWRGGNYRPGEDVFLLNIRRSKDVTAEAIHASYKITYGGVIGNARRQDGSHGLLIELRPAQ